MKKIFNFTTKFLFISIFIQVSFTASVAFSDRKQNVTLSKNNEFKITEETFILRSPHGYNIEVKTVRPKFEKYPDKRFPAVLRIAGGWGTSTFLLKNPMVKKIASYGLISVGYSTQPKKEKWEPDLRDFNGFKDQDDVAVVLRSILAHPNVNPEMVGIWSHSNGITLASGVLGREKYWDINGRIAFLLDDEGPYCPQDMLKVPGIRFHTKGIRKKWAKAVESKVGFNKQYQKEDDFFYERCAVNFIGNFKGIYQRAQGKDDHQTYFYHEHAVEMLNTATDGNAKWTRLNKEPKNQLYKSKNKPNAINIDNVLDVDKFQGANDKHIWKLLLNLFDQISN